jgi:membrane-associated phospholipid phosphatase
MRLLLFVACCTALLCVSIWPQGVWAGESRSVQLAEDVSSPGMLAVVAGAVVMPLLEDGKPGQGAALRTVDTLMCATLVTEALKLGVHSRRPDGRGDDSFPSEHATAAFAAATMAADRHPDQAPYWYGAAALVAYSRVRLNYHRPRDVVAGALIGFGVAKLEQSLPRGLLIAPVFDPEAEGGGVEVIWRF